MFNVEHLTARVTSAGAREEPKVSSFAVQGAERITGLDPNLTEIMNRTQLPGRLMGHFLRNRSVNMNMPPVKSARALPIEPGSISGDGGGGAPAWAVPAHAAMTRARPKTLRIARMEMEPNREIQVALMSNSLL
jgi:hypothetical protein